jgi:toxin ParE1/3/4
MSANLFWSQEAREDLFEIFLTIAQDNPSAAERVYNAIEDRAASLKLMPHLGVRRPDLAAPARAIIEGSYILLYRVYPDVHMGVVDEVEIVRVVHGSRDLSRVF